jgi:hypothetical protein
LCTQSDSWASQSSRIHDKNYALRWRILRYDEKVKNDLDVDMNFTNAQDHVPEAERNNQTIKERIQAAYCLKEENGQITLTPISIAKMTQIERKKAQQALMFLGEKQDKTVKGRMVCNGKPTREWLSRDDSISPTAALKSIMLIAVTIDAHQERSVITCGIPNAFIQGLMPKVQEGNKRLMMKITGGLVDMLVELNPELYKPYVVYEKTGKYFKYK